jgi:hypothetical protein
MAGTVTPDGMVALALRCDIYIATDENQDISPAGRTLQVAKVRRPGPRRGRLGSGGRRGDGSYSSDSTNRGPVFGQAEDSPPRSRRRTSRVGWKMRAGNSIPSRRTCRQVGCSAQAVEPESNTPPGDLDFCAGCLQKVQARRAQLTAGTHGRTRLGT